MAQPIPQRATIVTPPGPDSAGALREYEARQKRDVARREVATAFATALVAAGRGGDRESCLSLAIEWADALLEKLG